MHFAVLDKCSLKTFIKPALKFGSTKMQCCFEKIRTFKPQKEESKTTTTTTIVTDRLCLFYQTNDSLLNIWLCK